MGFVNATLLLEDGTSLEGEAFGAAKPAAGEVVFNTGMVGYTEAMTDPSYRGQILVFTYPHIGNYGIPMNGEWGKLHSSCVSPGFESTGIHVRGIVVSDPSHTFSHWAAVESLNAWMDSHGVTGISGIDTRALTKRLRSKGTMLGKIVVENHSCDWEDPNQRNLAAEVSVPAPIYYTAESGRADKRILLVDFGCKHSILLSLLDRGFDVLRVPWNYGLGRESVDGVVLSNGPGDPKKADAVLPAIGEMIETGIPILGICLGHQLLALASGGETYKLKYGHRSQNQPCIDIHTSRCHITSQNHGFAVDPNSLDSEWEVWFTNANDGTNEGMRHRSKPIFSVQFHPEAHPGPVDVSFIFDLFRSAVING